MSDHLNQYMIEFVSKFELVYPDIQFGDEIRDGEGRYLFSIKYLSELEKFCHLKRVEMTNSGQVWVGRDKYLVNDIYNVGLVVVVVYNEISQVLSFISQTYFFRDDQGIFHPFESYFSAVAASKKYLTHNMLLDIN